MTATATDAGYIRPEIAHLAVPIGELVPYPGNPRRGNHDKITASLRAHGQYKPLLVQASTGYIVAGNNTWHVMRDQGWTEAAAVRLDIDDDRARAMLLIDNAASDDADYDDRALAELLAEIVDWEATGWSPDDLDDLLNKLGDDVAELPAAVAAAAPQELTAVPATDAAYAEAPEQEAARAARLATQIPHYAKGLEEMILLLAADDRAEAVRLVTAVRAWLGSDLSSGEVVLRALRTLTVIGDERHSPNATINIAALLKAAGYTEPESG